ncbi:MAG: DUF1573 domain-containing protein [bacterium]|nr:DUF1573 domain-containing protein [bacterium]
MKKLLNKYFWTSVVVTVVVLLLIVAGNSGQAGQQSTTAGVLTVAEAMHDFGTISMQNGTVSYQYELVNTGTEAVVIQEAYTSCMCTTATIIDSKGERHGVFGMTGHGLQRKASIEVPPGKSVTVEAVFDPAAHGPSGVGTIERTVTVETNSESASEVNLDFRATVTR